MPIQIRRCETLTGGCGLLVRPGATGTLKRLRGACRARGWRADAAVPLPGTGLRAVFVRGPDAGQFRAALAGDPGFDLSACSGASRPIHVHECAELPGGCGVTVPGADEHALRTLWCACARHNWDIWPASLPGGAGFLQAFIPGPNAEQLEAALAGQADFDFAACPRVKPFSPFPPYGTGVNEGN